MKIERSQLIWIVVITLVLAGGLYAGHNWFEIVDADEWVGMQGEARRDPYLAAKRLLGEMGANATTVRESASLDALPAGGTLMLGDRRLARMPDERVAKIKAWVQGGGHLIVEAEQPRLDDPVLAAFGLSHAGLSWTAKGYVEKRENDGDVKSNGFPVAPEDVPADDNDTPQKARIAPGKFLRPQEVTVVTFPDGSRFRVEFQPYQNVKVKTGRENAVTASDRAGLRMIHFAEGRGMVTALSNFDFMVGRNLTKFDHAEFLWHLAALRSPKPLMVLALRANDVSLWQWLGQHAWPVLWTFLVLLLAWIARIVPRFGPLRRETAPARLSLGEHLAAAGRFIGRRRAWPALLRAARERFVWVLHRERPGLARAGRLELVRVLESVSGIGAVRIDQALYVDVNDRRGFIDVIRTLKAMESALSSRRTMKVN